MKLFQFVIRLSRRYPIRSGFTVNPCRKMSVKTSPYGSWASPISSQRVTESSVSFQEVRVDWDENARDTVYWTECRFDEGGRYVVCSHKQGTDGNTTWTPADYSSRTTVHEYGGGATLVNQGKVYFCNFKDQALYRQDGPSVDPVRITPEGAGLRYADGQYHNKLNKIYCVREDHSVVEKKEAKEPANTVVTVSPQDGSQHVLASGCDFYSCPRVSPDGKKIAWVQWNHPNMKTSKTLYSLVVNSDKARNIFHEHKPWDSTALIVAELSEDGNSVVKGSETLMAGGVDISVQKPSWTHNNELLYIGDQTDWWNLYHVTAAGEHVNLMPRDVECGGPHWVFGQSSYMLDPRGNGDIVTVYGKELGIYNMNTKAYRQIKTEFTFFQYVTFGGNGQIYAFAGSPTKFSCIIQIDSQSGEVKILRESKKLDMDTGYFSVPEEISWETTGGEKTYGYYYPPTNKDFKAPEGTFPPLLVKNHGGPTASTMNILNLRIQYFTSRGMGVLDMNYRGSTGYGKKYRHRLRLNWGVTDLDDSCTGALYLANSGRADKKMLCIDGGSAGGYTTLAVLAFKDVFSAGVSHYGVADLEALAQETHKFESRYLDTMIGPYKSEADKQVYKDRSPINHVDKLTCALALFQGDEDKIVPPNQAQMMYDAVKAKGLPTMHVVFKGEQHGFRKAENMQTALDGEFYFFSKVFGYEAADKHINIPIDNL